MESIVKIDRPNGRVIKANLFKVNEVSEYIPLTRFEYSRFDPDPRLRHSVWNVVIGGSIFWCSVFGTNQAQVQRAISVRNVARAKM